MFGDQINRWRKILETGLTPQVTSQAHETAWGLKLFSFQKYKLTSLKSLKKYNMKVTNETNLGKKVVAILPLKKNSGEFCDEVSISSGIKFIAENPGVHAPLRFPLSLANLNCLISSGATKKETAEFHHQ